MRFLSSFAAIPDFCNYLRDFLISALPSALRNPSSVLCPSVSVILPIRNEAPFIEQVLRAVLNQDYPPDLLEAVVVDGMSDDGTREIVRELAAQDPRLRLLDNPRHITPAGLNLAIRAARGSVIVRVDGHGVLPPNYVRECVARLGGRTEGGGRGAEGRRLKTEGGGRRTEGSRPSSILRLLTSGFRPPSSALRLLVSALWPWAGRGIQSGAAAWEKPSPSP